MTTLAPLPVQSFRDSNGNPLAGGSLYTYTAGTSTPLATYTDSTGATPNANPIVLNSRGEANVWLATGFSYKFALYDSLAVLIWTVDNVTNGAAGGTPVALASTATTDIGSQTSQAVEISGTTAITSLGTNYNGPRFLRFTGALVLTQSAALNLPGGANITTAAGDTAIAYPNLALNGWNIVGYQLASGLVSNASTTIYTTGGTSTAYAITPVPAITAYAIGQSFMVNFAMAPGVAPTLAFNGIATPPNLVKENASGTYSNLLANDFPINHRSRVTLISTTQALVERFPAIAGTVLQMVSYALDAGGSTTSASIVNSSGSNKTIAPKSDNSIIVIEATFQGAEALLAGVNTTATFQVMESGTAIGAQYNLGVATGSGGTSSQSPCAIAWRVLNNALTARSFTLGAASNSTSATASATSQMFTITEIQA